MAMADCFYVTLGWDIWRNQVYAYGNALNFKLEQPRFSKEILSDSVTKDVAKLSFPFPVWNSGNV